MDKFLLKKKKKNGLLLVPFVEKGTTGVYSGNFQFLGGLYDEISINSGNLRKISSKSRFTPLILKLLS